MMFRLYVSLHNLNVVLALQYFIVDRELYLDMAFSSIMRKPGGGGREEPCCIPSIYRAIKLVVSHMARSTDAEAALSEY